MKLPRRTLVQAAAGIGLAGLIVAAGLILVRQRTDTGVYIGVGVAAAGFVAALVLERERLTALARGRQARYGSNAVLAGAALLAILVLVNVVAFQNPKSWDLTEDSQYSLAPETIEALDRLSTDGRLIGFYSAERRDAQDAVRPLLQRYQEESGGKISYEFIDPRENPFLAQQYGVTRDATIVVDLGGASEVAPFASEQEITGALVRLANPGERTVVFLTGHGERDPQATDEAGYDQLRQALVAKNYTVETLSLLGSPRVPEGALAVIVAGPTAPMTQAEIDALRAYVDAGGSLVVLADPPVGTSLTPEGDLLGRYLADAWGVQLRNDVVVDLGSSMPLAAIAASYATHPVTDRLQSLATYFPSARSLALEAGGQTAAAGVPLVLTGANSWGETRLDDLAGQSRIEFNESEDTPGPLTVAATAEDFRTGSRLLVVGDSDFGANADFFGLGNGDLLVNGIDWAAGQENLISLTPKEITDRYVTPPSQGIMLLMGLVSVVLVPGSFLVLGISTWWTRRARG